MFPTLIQHFSLLSLVAIVYSMGARNVYTRTATFQIIVPYLPTTPTEILPVTQTIAINTRTSNNMLVFGVSHPVLLYHAAKLAIFVI